MIKPSTFSIVAFDPGIPAWGIAVASKFPAVGSVVPWARAEVGAVATQSYANTSYGPNGLDLIASGMNADQVLARLLEDDPERESRQVGIVDANGKAATFTGSSCFDWAGGVIGPGFAAQGNILAGPQVVNAIADTYKITHGPFPRRLLSALLAGDRAGGDRRGRQSAAILVVKPHGGYGGFNDRWIDYRVDDHPDPVVRLSELLELHDLYFGESPLEDKLAIRGEILGNLYRILKQHGYNPGSDPQVYSEGTRIALRAFIGNENFEERVDFDQGLIDRPVYEFLLKRFVAK
jgi:uncharacterized Ntn-hydrolase superfamily protein